MQTKAQVVSLAEYRRKKYGCNIADEVDKLLETGERLITQSKRAEKIQKFFVYFIAPIYVFYLIIQAIKNF